MRTGLIANCSTTARLGARKWAPRFEAAITQHVFPAPDGGGAHNDQLLAALDTHPIHDVLDALHGYRPALDIAVS